MFGLVVLIIVFIKFKWINWLESLVLFVFIGLFEMKMVGMFKCIVVINIFGVILL